MPIYEFQCGMCERRFDELVANEDVTPPCPDCGSERVQRLFSPVSPPGRQPRGAKVRSDESRRGERESAHQERLASDRAKRAQGEQP